MTTQVFQRIVWWMTAVVSLAWLTAADTPLPNIHFGERNDPSNDILGPQLSKEEMDSASHRLASLDKDGTHLPAVGSPKQGAMGSPDPIAASGYFQGDIVLPSPDHFYQIMQGSSDAQASAESDPHKKWPNGVVPYVISDNFSGAERNVIAGAIVDLARHTCIRFIPRQPHHLGYVHILKGNGCSSEVGHQGRWQVVSLGAGCVYHGIVLHEFLHALGFWHEQARPDRDLHVWVNWINVLPNMTFNFEMKSNKVTTNLGLSYDYTSVMHYGPNAFARDPSKPTLVPKLAGVHIGQRRGLSQMDVEGVNRLYQCRLSNNKPNQVDTPTPKKCVDDHSACWKWARENWCEKNSFVSTTCRKSCNKCSSD
ncbi:hatching enzyme 1.2 [Procambarus clarkii]|uniref:hatching enzyme 1.2 n=1 Tax=Procambarus clarkii TaxID=6728 RepID=UPI003742E9AE